MKQPALYTANMKLADLIETDYKLLLLLPRFNIALGLGDKTVTETCEKYKISPDLFLIICNIYSFKDYIPQGNEIGNLDIPQLISYLTLSHQYYLINRLKPMDGQIKVIASNSQKSHGEILKRFFTEYRNEVINHFNYEETIVFPYILGVADGKKSAGFQIQIFEKNHSNIQDKLGDLKNILIKYLPGNSSLSDKTSLLFNVFDLEEDLRKHTLIEDLVLVPNVRKMESHYGTK